MSYEYDSDGVKQYLQKEYQQKYYKELLMKLLEEAHDEGLISHNELFISYVNSRQDISSFYVMTLSILADTIEDVYYDMTDVYNSNKIEYAMGSDLDSIGDIIGCPRPQATKSGVLLRFKLGMAYDIPLLIPRGINVLSDSNISYTTVETVTIPIGDTEFDVYALADESGVDSHTGANTLTNLNTEIILDDGNSLSLSVTNPLSSSGGREAFTDEEYRLLLLDWVKNNIKGSGEAFERYFSTMDGLDSYKLVPNWNGVTGTVKVVLDPGYPYQLKQAYDDLNTKITQFSEDITLHPPSYVPINVYAVCDVDIDQLNPYSSTEKKAIKSKIEDAIKIYIDGDDYSDYVGLKIGEDFIPYQLGVFIANNIPEVKNIGFNYPLNPISISDEEMCKSNDINVDMKSVSSFKEIDVDNDGDYDYIGYSL